MLCLGTGGVVVVHLSCTLLFGPGSLSLFWSNEITQKYQRKTVPTGGFVWGLVLMRCKKKVHAYTCMHTNIHIQTNHITLLWEFLAQ